MGESRSGGSLWVFYCVTKAAFYNGLTFQEARAIAKILTPDERPHWLVWKEGWSQWKKLSSAGELLATTSSVLRVMDPPPLPKELDSEPTLSDSAVVVIDDKDLSSALEPLTPEPSEEPSASEAVETKSSSQYVLRKDQRVTVELDVEIFCQGRKFKSTTVDISIGGVQIKDPIPGWMAGYGTLILKRPDVKQSLEFVCSIVEDQAAGNKRRLEIHPSKDTAHLKRWMLDFLVMPPSRKKSS